MGNHTLEIVNAGGIITLDAIYAENLASYPTHVSETAATYTANWANTPHQLFTNGTLKMSRGILDDSARYTFIGTKVRVIGLTGPIFGKVNVKIDGSLYSSIDLYRSDFGIQATIETIAGLSYGLHTVEIVSTGTKNPLSVANLVNIDGFGVW